VAALAVTAILAGGAARGQENDGAAAVPTASPSPSPSLTPAPESSATAAASPSPAPTPTQAECASRSLDPTERDTILRLAWQTLAGHLTDHPIKDTDLEAYTFTPCLMAPRGLFVTLKKGEQVRGLQGEIEATRPLYQQVIVFTRRAATRDPRFLPLTERDLGALTIELSIIRDRHKVTAPSDVKLDSEGLFLEKWGRRALFLPGIAARQGWSAGRTLDELCSQAALPKGSWSESARIEAFSAELIAGGPPIAGGPAPSPSPAPPAGPGAETTTPGR